MRSLKIFKDIGSHSWLSESTPGGRLSVSLGKSHSAEFDGGRPWVRGRILPREVGKDYTLHDKLKVTEPQGFRQSCQNSADRSGFCKPPEGWHADKLE